MQESEIDVTNVQEKGWFGKIKDWSYENWQTVLIVLIVLIVGISAYNYNQQGGNIGSNSELAAVTDNESGNNDKNYSKEGKSGAELNISDDNQESKIENADEKKAADEDDRSESVNNTDEEPNSVNNEEKGSVLSSNSNVSGKTYTITAKYGEGITHLARRALEEYLNSIENGSELTKEHKIYIEDYIQNKTGNQKIEIGHQETFSADLIQEAISNANKLSQKSLDNLSKYTKNVK